MDLKGFGGIEGNASLVLLLNRILVTKEDTLDIDIARSCQAGLTIPLIFNPDRLVFGEAYNRTTI